MNPDFEIKEYTPIIDDLWFREELLSDEKTMSFNHAYGGIIQFPKERWTEWYNKWISKEPDRYFAYIYVDKIKEPIGEIYYYPDGDIHSMGILVVDKYRGKGYSYPALMELEKVAFEKNNINELSDMVPLDRVGAIKTFKKAGFIHTDKEVIEKVFDKESTIRQLLITKDMYFNKKESGNYE